MKTTPAKIDWKKAYWEMAAKNDLYKQRAEAAEAKLRELEMQEPVGWQNCATGDMSMYKRSENDRPLYSKPFQHLNRRGR